MTWLLLLPVALAAGMAAPTQFAINSQLRQVVGGPVLAAALSFLVGTVILFATTAVVRRSVPDLPRMLLLRHREQTEVVVSFTCSRLVYFLPIGER
jgi:uncharacterized membrane protein YdcZ (DUF606 family)